LIDFEYANYNFRGFDFGNFFCEWTINNNYPHYPHFQYEPSLYPSLETQRDFFTHYLQSIYKNTPEAIPPQQLQQQVESLVEEAKVFRLCSHIFWGIWAVLQSKYSAIEFGFLEYAKVRLGEFVRLQDLYQK